MRKKWLFDGRNAQDMPYKEDGRGSGDMGSAAERLASRHRGACQPAMRESIFRALKEHLQQCDTCPFARQKGMYRNSLWHRMLHG